ncbi:Uncharacterized protein FWK35_00028371, partial [Aphis craccivora]
YQIIISSDDVSALALLEGTPLKLFSSIQSANYVRFPTPSNAVLAFSLAEQVESVSFKTSASPIFIDSDINVLIDEAFATLLNEEEIYKGKGSGFSLEKTDCLLLSVYKYTPMGDTPNIQIPIRYIDNSTNNDNNSNNTQDNSSFNEEADNYASSSYIKLPPSLINKRATMIIIVLNGPFWQNINNLVVSVNVHRVNKISLERSHVYPIKVVDDEKANHFDIILYSDVNVSDDVPLELIEKFNTPTTPVIYRGSGSREELLKTNVPICMSDEDTRRHNGNNHCNLCKYSLNKNEKVRDHCHLSGKFRQTLCSKCNISLQQPKFVPCFFHNLTNYDAHFIVTELGCDAKTIKVIPNSEEKFVTFSKYISKTFTIRFVDTCRFMATKLENLAKNLLTPDFSKFRETSKHFSAEDMSLVTRKGVNPYEYTDDWSKLEQTTLPPLEDFHSSLTEKNIEDNVFENFGDVCMQAYNLDPAYYFTAPAYSFDAMLKQTVIKLELLSDYDMLLMFEYGIRGGLVQVSMRYAKTNNYKAPDFDPTKPNSWLIYQDRHFDLIDTSPIGRIYEVDVMYPEELHDLHNDLPFLPQNGVPVGSKVTKLMATFESKKNYIVRYRSLQQAIKNGLIVNKVHRVIQFNQSAWLAEYIKLNTEMKKRALNDFEKDFFKLMNNAIFGKTMEQVRRRIKVELVSSDDRLRKLLNKTTFKHATAYNENLSAIKLENKIIKFDKPIYIGLAVLDISKTLMYDYHYNVMKRHYGEKISLMYTDT